jgi:putative SOS response-associated peptidase YedK
VLDIFQPCASSLRETAAPLRGQAVRFRLRSREPFAFAGLYETWRSPSGEKVHTCTIVTIEPNALIAPIHDQMPVILSRAGEALWPDSSIRESAALMPLLE